MSESSLTITVRPYRLAMRTPLATARGAIAGRDGFVVRVSDPSGLAGYGEVAPLPGHGGEALEEAEHALGVLSTWLQAEADELSGERLVSFARLIEVSGILAEMVPSAPAARAGLTLALADLFARRERLPLSRWLSPDAAAEVEVNGTLGALEPGEAGRRAVAIAADGFRTIKIKLDADVEGSLARVAAVAEATEHAAQPVALRGDANGAWDAPTALKALEALAVFHLQYVEQPVKASDVAGLSRLRRDAPVPVAADEALLVPGGAERALALDAADVYVLKPSLIGGPAAAWLLATRALEVGADVVVTSSLEGAVGREGALHLAAALPGCDLACGLATGSRLEADLAQATQPAHGAMQLSDRPGLGLDVDMDRLPK